MIRGGMHTLFGATSPAAEEAGWALGRYRPFTTSITVFTTASISFSVSLG